MPEGYVWGVGWSEAYPGLKYVQGSPLAQEWSDKLGKSMHQIRIETNAYNLFLVFHDVSIRKIQQGNPDTRELTPIEVEESTN